MALNSIFNTLLGWTLLFGKLWSVVIISFIVTLMTTLVYKFLTNQKEMKELKENMKAFQKQVKENKHDVEKVKNIQKEMMAMQMKYMRHSWKPMLYTFLPLILIFGWMRATFNSGIDVLSWGSNIPLFGTGLGWLGIYIISSIIFSTILRKYMKVH
jgi:uncharacterized membrane protein (DUF106 family)